MVRLGVFVGCLCVLAGAARAESALKECWGQSANRIELGACLKQAKTAADAKLKEVYQAALAAQRERDAFTGQRRGARAVVRSQMAFTLYRSLECNVWELQMGSGTGSGDAFLTCWIDMTRDRIALLTDLTPADAPGGLSGAWRVVTIAGEAVLAKARPSLEFADGGKVSGSAGCNRFFGEAKVAGESISVSELLGATMKVCGEVIDAQERRFFQALRAVRALDLDGDRLVLKDHDDKPVMRLERVR